ncbi:hypothetical protein KNU02_gp76 [Gordonia phage Pleakley]|uniref:Uncharacterized protein n=1 Tax=Gordonia phage Pleakley TaxID=2283246 RepID=A0A345M6J4_9CAUD|nr:hypothetical protein KNU02_gp76 [Gordonia phage Pleakley]AXH49801.1 hypothetical protein SEA_FURY_76 [Gordonia phage Fury]AXH66115.1 hypothetical protein SEA_PLEAKLEY_76 [Gordonia phage Pleakley]
MTEPNYPSPGWSDMFVPKSGPPLWPTIEFFYLDEKHPRTPSHVWWISRAFAVDPVVFHRSPTTTLSPEDFVHFDMGSLELIDNLPEELATNLSALRLRSAKIQIGEAFADFRSKFEEGQK